MDTARYENGTPIDGTGTNSNREIMDRHSYVFLNSTQQSIR